MKSLFLLYIMQSTLLCGPTLNNCFAVWLKTVSYTHLDVYKRQLEGYQRESYLIPVQTARFGSGEAKCTIMESVRGDDIYLMVRCV